MRKLSSINFFRYLSFVCLLSLGHGSLACTAINLTAKDGTVIAGRTMEWEFDMKWELIALPRDTSINMDAPSSLSLPVKKLSSIYAFVAVAPAILEGPPAFLEGQNEAGLGMSGNFLPGVTEYQTVTAQDRNYVSIINFGRLALGMFRSIEELRAELPKYKVWFEPSLTKGIPTPPWLHFVFTDRSGESVVIEFVKGQMVIHDNEAKVLTNAPTYDWHLWNIRNYLSLSDKGRVSAVINSANVTEVGQGGGLLGLPADYTPPSRFVRAAYLRHFATQPKGSKGAVQLMAHLLNNVDIPIGVAKSTAAGRIVSDYTQWVAIKDLSNNVLKIADYDHRTNYTHIDLNRVFASGKSMSWPIKSLPYPADDLTSKLLNGE